MSRSLLKNQDTLSRSPLYSLLKTRVKLSNVERFQGAFFARSDYLANMLAASSSAIADEQRSGLQAEMQMLLTALGFLSGDSPYDDAVDRSGEER